MRHIRQVGLFVRIPRYGLVKTRLGRGIGRLEALRFYRNLSSQVIARLGADRRWRLTIWVTPDRAYRPGRIWPMARRGLARARLHDQGRGHLGQRMGRALLGSARRGPMIVVGSDIPDLSAAYVWQGFTILARHHTVFASSGDGGYWLIGVSCNRTRLGQSGNFLAKVRWSSAYALADSMASLPPSTTIGFAATLSDIDDTADYQRWRNRLRNREPSKHPDNTIASPNQVNA